MAATPVSVTALPDKVELGAPGAPAFQPGRQALAPAEDRGEVIDGLEDQERTADRRLAEDVGRKQGQDRLFQLERMGRRHEHLAQRRRGDAVDKPGERLESVLDGPFVTPQAARRHVAVAQRLVDDPGADLAAVHGEEHAAREYRSYERIRVPDHQIAVP